MNENSTNQKYDYTISGFFNGKPCEVIEEWHIILPHWRGMSFEESMEFIKSEEFQSLVKAGIEVHSGTYS